MLKQPRPKTSSADAHMKLREIYDERIGTRMSQAQFAKLYDIGSPCILTQYLNGSKPLGVEAAARFAKALGCTIEDFAPDLAERFNEEVLPFLGNSVGKKLRRAAMIVMSIPALSSLAPSDAQASSKAAGSAYYVKRLRRILRCVGAQGFRGLPVVNRQAVALCM